MECLLFDISLFLYFIAYFFYFQDTPFDARIRLIASICIVLSGVNLCRFRSRGISKCAVWYLTFIAFAYISSAWAVDDLVAKSIITTLLRIAIVGIFLQIRVEARDDINRILEIYVWATLYSCVAIALTMMTMYSFDMLTLTRYGDTFGYNSNLTAMMCAISSTICIARMKVHPIRNVAFVAFFAVIVALCGSKKGVIGLVLGFLIVLLFKEKGGKKIVYFFIGLLVGFFIFFFVIMNPTLYDIIGHRLVAFWDILIGENAYSQSTVERMELIRQAVDVWYNNFFFGIGMNNFSIVQTVSKGYYAHCNYVELLADLGIIGFILYYSLPVYLVFSKSSIRYDSFVLKGIVVLLLFFDFALVSYQLIQFQIFYWLLASATIEGCRLNEDRCYGASKAKTDF